MANAGFLQQAKYKFNYVVTRIMAPIYLGDPVSLIYTKVSTSIMLYQTLFNINGSNKKVNMHYNPIWSH